MTMGSSQQPRNGISSFMPRTEYPVQVKILLLYALLSLPWKKFRRKKMCRSCNNIMYKGDDYGIVTTATEWYFILYASDGISRTSKNPLTIRFTESALEEVSEEENV